MDWWIWLLIILGVLLLIGIIVVGGRAARERQLEGKRAEATELRREAQERSESAEQRERFAAEEADRARREREAAEERARRADEVDPDVDSDADDGGDAALRR
jgi:FtsZ-interacting cell division protein ZipA